MRDRPTQASQTVVEILPNRLRALLMAAISLAVWVFVYFWLINHFFDANSFTYFGDHPDFYAPDLFGKFGSPVVFAVVALAFALNVYTVGSMLMPWPRPRLRVTRERLDYLGPWRTKSFAWSEFGRFSVKNVRVGRQRTVKVRALPPGVAEPTGFAGWFGTGPQLLSFDLLAFVPFQRNNVAEGEELVRWILDLREGRDTPPPEMLTVRRAARATAGPTGATPAAKGKAAKVTSNQTVVRR